MKIALVQAMCGHVTCVGPNDFMNPAGSVIPSSPA